MLASLGARMKHNTGQALCPYCKPGFVPPHTPLLQRSCDGRGGRGCGHVGRI